MYEIEFELSRPTEATLDENTTYLFLENKEWKFIIVSNQKKILNGDLKDIAGAQEKLDEFLEDAKTTYNEKRHLENITTDDAETILKMLLSQQNSRFEFYHNVGNSEPLQKLLELIKPDSKDAQQESNFKSLLTVLKEIIRLRIYYLSEWFALKHQKKADKKVKKLVADTQEAINDDNLNLAQAATSLHQTYSNSIYEHEVTFDNNSSLEIECYATLQISLGDKMVGEESKKQALQIYCSFFYQSEAPVNAVDHQPQSVSRPKSTSGQTISSCLKSTVFTLS